MPRAKAAAHDVAKLQPEEGPADGMTGRGVHVVDAMLYLAGQRESIG